MAKLSAVAPPTDLTPGALDLNDLVELEETYGSLETLDFSRLAIVRHILWLDARHRDPDITKEAVGAGFTLERLAGAADHILVLSGLRDPEGDAEGNGEPAPAG